jgi:hypothetical protein
MAGAQGPTGPAGATGAAGTTGATGGTGPLGNSPNVALASTIALGSVADTPFYTRPGTAGSGTLTVNALTLACNTGLTVDTGGTNFKTITVSVHKDTDGSVVGTPTVLALTTAAAGTGSVPAGANVMSGNVAQLGSQTIVLLSSFNVLPGYTVSYAVAPVGTGLATPAGRLTLAT